MKLLSVFRKSLLEQLRERWSLMLMLVTAPFFVFLYWLFFGGGSTTYDVLVINQDTGVMIDGQTWNAGEEVVTALKTIRYANDQPMLAVKRTSDRAAAERKLRDRDATALLVIPANFSAVLQAEGQLTTTPEIVGDLTNTYYSVAAVLVQAALDGYLDSLTDQPQPVQPVETPLGQSGTRTEFELYVPGLLIFAVMMLVFPVAMAISGEIEAGTLTRLQITRMSGFDLLGGISVVQLLIGVAAAALTLLTGIVLGFHVHGSVITALLVCTVTSFSVIGVGLLVACFARTVSQAFLIANFPLILMMFFSGSIYPIPQTALFTVAGRSFGLYDILPPSHAVVALNKVLTLGEGIESVTFELGAVLVLSAVYFVGGVGLFHRRYLAQH